MNYPKMSESGKKLFSVNNFGGINAVNTSDNSMRFALNTELSDGAFKTRKAVSATGVNLGELNRSRAQSFQFTDAVTLLNGVYSQLTVQYMALGSFSYRYAFKLLSADGTVTDAATIEFPRGADGTIKMPQSIICFTASPVKGSGIFALIKVQINTANMYIFEAYELSDDMSVWYSLSEEEMYIPDYYINGRGNMYHMCEVTLPEPEFLEPLNMLSGICNCYYSTDGASNGFYLPFKALDTSKEDYLKFDLLADYATHLIFTIPSGSGVSNKVSYNGYEINVSCNNGYFFFTSNPAGFVPQKIYGYDNNLKVTIKHETDEDYRKKANMTLSGWYNFSGTGSRLVLAGNTEIPSLMMVSAENNPFYIPHNNCVNVGQTGQKIVAIAPCRDSLMVLKEGEIYKADIASGKVTAKFLTGNIGCSRANSAKAVHNKVFFVGTDNKIYALLFDGTVKEISVPINDSISVLGTGENIFAFSTYDKYILVCDNCAYVLSLSASDSALKNPAWDLWRFPSDSCFVGGVAYGEDIALVGRAAVSTVIYYYAAVMSESNEDSYYASEYYMLEQKTAPISTEILTHAYNFGSEYNYKSVDRLLLNIYCKGNFTVSFIDEKGDTLRTKNINISYENEKPRVLRLFPFLRAVKCAVSISSANRLELRGMGFEYRKLSE